MRKISKPLSIGEVTIGGGAPIIVQSMTKTDTRNISDTVKQIKELEEVNCRLVRVAIPDKEAGEALSFIKRQASIPIMADIHFDHRLALLSLEAGADAVRINPGTMKKEGIIKVVKSAKERSIPIRIGVNAGSLPEDLKEGSLAEKMVKTALRGIEICESLNFDLIEVSLKAFDVLETIEANRMIAQKVIYPIHLGITEAGPFRSGVVRSAIGIGILLYEGIGDSLRVSLTAHPCEEVVAGYEILKSLNLERRGPLLITCPTCGRCEVDLTGLVSKVEKELAKIEKPIKVALMGCIVNGPGEAREADIGLACGKGRGALFLKGKIIRTVEERDFLKVLMEEMAKL